LIIKQCSIIEYVTNPGSYRFTSQTGRSLSTKAYENLRSLVSGNKPIVAKCLSSINGISPATANALVETISNIKEMTFESLKDIIISGKRLGDARAHKIIDLLKYKKL